MPHNNAIFVLLLVCWVWSRGESGVITSQSHTIGGYKHSQKKNSISELDCSQFSNDYDIIQQFSFPFVMNPIDVEFDFNHSAVRMNKNNTFVEMIFIYEEDVVPASVFCLSNLQRLHIVGTPFEDGIVPDVLANLKRLEQLWIYDSPIVKITEQLGKLDSITKLSFGNCSLSYVPNLRNLQKMTHLQLDNNNLSQVDGIPDVTVLDLSGNRFTQIPILMKRNNLRFLIMNNNPLENAEPITSYSNLKLIVLNNSTISSIPSTIDKLQDLVHLDISNNKITHLPTSILNLPHLEYLHISNNLIPDHDIQLLRKAFKKSHPKLGLYT